MSSAQVAVTLKWSQRISRRQEEDETLYSNKDIVNIHHLTRKSHFKSLEEFSWRPCSCTWIVGWWAVIVALLRTYASTSWYVSCTGVLKYGKDFAHSPEQDLRDICRDLHCQIGRVKYTSHPALEGSACGNNRVSSSYFFPYVAASVDDTCFFQYLQYSPSHRL